MEGLIPIKFIIDQLKVNYVIIINLIRLKVLIDVIYNL
jgi:hypothetical protein